MIRIQGITKSRLIGGGRFGLDGSLKYWLDWLSSCLIDGPRRGGSMKAEPQVDTDVDKGSSSTGDLLWIKWQ